MMLNIEGSYLFAPCCGMLTARLTTWGIGTMGPAPFGIGMLDR